MDGGALTKGPDNEILFANFFWVEDFLAMNVKEQLTFEERFGHLS
jgi:hypothetical protein